jgi:hypothetical protein
MTLAIGRLQQIITIQNPSFTFPLQNEPVNIKEAINHWKQAKQDLKQCQKNSAALRHQSYEDLLEMLRVQSQS